MASSRQRISDLFNAALGLPPEEREDYLDANCADAPDVRREVVSLLEAYGSAGSFMDTPAMGQVAPGDHETMTDALIGQELEGYRIRDVLGRGGMGVVYRAEDVALSRTVALKMIDPALARDATFLRRFRAEARALARIDSPHIVGVYALRQADQGLLIAMECVEGGTLADRLAEGALPEAEALSLFKQMLRAFDDAHGAGVIHRDIKPHNIMLTEGGTVKVTDFGLARLQQRGTQVTVTQGVAGTLNYMSPEQVQGRSDLDHRSDLYALGMVLYELLAGRLPFEKGQSNFARMRIIVEEELSSPDTFRPELPDDLVQIVMKALRKDPEQRYQSAGAMLEAVEEAETRRERAGGARQETPWPAVGRRSLRLAAMGGVLVLLLMLGGYLFYMQRTPAGGEARPSPSAALTISTEPAGATAYVNGRSVGQTPLEGLAVESGSLDVLLKKDGYAPFDTTLRARAGTPLRLDLRLAGVPATARPSDTEPEEEGATTQQASTGAEGPTEAGPEETAPAPARLTLRVEPTGTVAVAGERRSGAGTFEVPPGRHTVRFSHPRYGTEEAAVTLTAGQSRQLTYYFEHTLSVNTTGPWGSIWINGENTGEATPNVFRLGPGTYRVEVRIKRSADYNVTGGAHRVEAGGRTKTTQFSRPVETIVIEPSFEPRKHLLQFRVE